MCDGANLVAAPEKVRQGEVLAFDVYFASIAGFQFHPGAGTKEHRKLTLQECADMATEMVRIRRKTLGES